MKRAPVGAKQAGWQIQKRLNVIFAVAASEWPLTWAHASQATRPDQPKTLFWHNQKILQDCPLSNLTNPGFCCQAKLGGGEELDAFCSTSGNLFAGPGQLYCQPAFSPFITTGGRICTFIYILSTRVFSSNLGGQSDLTSGGWGLYCLHGHKRDTDRQIRRHRNPLSTFFIQDPNRQHYKQRRLGTLRHVKIVAWVTFSCAIE